MREQITPENRQRHFFFFFSFFFFLHSSMTPVYSVSVSIYSARRVESRSARHHHVAHTLHVQVLPKHNFLFSLPASDQEHPFHLPFSLSDPLFRLSFLSRPILWAASLDLSFPCISCFGVADREPDDERAEPTVKASRLETFEPSEIGGKGVLSSYCRVRTCATNASESRPKLLLTHSAQLIVQRDLHATEVECKKKETKSEKAKREEREEELIKRNDPRVMK